MLQDLIDWLDKQVTERGLARFIFYAAAFVGTIGVPFGSALFQAAVVVTVAVLAMATAVALVSKRRSAELERVSVSKLMERYCKVIQERPGLKLEYLDWSQSITINPRGDAVITRRLRVAPAGDDLHFLAFNQVYYGSMPLSPGLRRRVHATAHEIAIDGMGGPRHAITTAWRSDVEHQILVHFPVVVPAGHQVTVEVQWVWPLYSAGLMHGHFEDFDVTFDHPTENVTYEVELVKESAGARFAVSGIGPVVPSVRSTAAKTIVRFSMPRPVQGERLGVRLDKER